jgi:hypothetical protein
MARRLAQSKARAESRVCGRILALLLHGMRSARTACAPLLLVLLAATGCSAWYEMDPPKTGVALEPDQQSRLTLDDGTKLKVSGLRVEGDTMRFHPKEDSLLSALAASRVVRYEQKDDDILGTVLLAGAIGAGIYFAFVIIRALGME